MDDLRISRFMDDLRISRFMDDDRSRWIDRFSTFRTIEYVSTRYFL